MNNLAINGFGRIGRLFLRQAYDRDYDVTAINDPLAKDPGMIAYLFKHDTIHGRFNGKIWNDKKNLILNGKKIRLFKELNPGKVPWHQTGAEYVLESSGKFNTVCSCKGFLEGGAKKVVISGISKDAPLYICGVNLNKYNPKHKIVSMASGTTNAIAPLAKLLNDKFGIEEALVTIVHPITRSQAIIDGKGATWRESRGGYQNITPHSCSAFPIVEKILPSLKGKIAGFKFKVPIPDVCALDLSVRFKKCTNYKTIKCVLKEAAANKYKGVLGYTEESVVSTDFLGCTCSAVFDACAGITLNQKCFKLVAWFDNEVSYSARLIDLMKYMQDQDIIAKEKSALKKCKCKPKC